MEHLHITLRVLAAGAVAASLTAAPAMAQTDGVRSGPYVGGTLGAGWSDTSARTRASPGAGPVILPPADIAAIDASASKSSDAGFAGSVEAGYNIRRGSVLLGIETDYGLFNVRQTSRNSIPSTTSLTPSQQYTIEQDLSSDWMWTVRPRLGYADGPWLVYVTGGLAASRINYRMDFADPLPAGIAHLDVGDTKTGWVAGLGSGYAVNRNWSVKGEWLHADLGSVDGSAHIPLGTVNLTSTAIVKVNVLRIGVDYAF